MTYESWKDFLMDSRVCMFCGREFRSLRGVWLHIESKHPPIHVEDKKYLKGVSNG